MSKSKVGAPSAILNDQETLTPSLCMSAPVAIPNDVFTLLMMKCVLKYKKLLPICILEGVDVEDVTNCG